MSETYRIFNVEGIEIFSEIHIMITRISLSRAGALSLSLSSPTRCLWSRSPQASLLLSTPYNHRIYHFTRNASSPSTSSSRKHRDHEPRSNSRKPLKTRNLPGIARHGEQQIPTTKTTSKDHQAQNQRKGCKDPETATKKESAPTHSGEANTKI